MKRLLVYLCSVFVCVACMAQKQKSENEFLSEILAGKVFFLDGEKSVNEFPWNPHASFKGVYLKHLIIGRDTESKLSCHIVKIEPNCVLDTHVHDGKIEIHEVIAGNGKMYLDNKKINYSPGKICVIPSNTPHKVVAGKKGMYILAKFTPSLL